MNEEAFNLELRKFLKRFGVTAQREIEKAVDVALKSRKLTGNEVLPVRATLAGTIRSRTIWVHVTRSGSS